MIPFDSVPPSQRLKMVTSERRTTRRYNLSIPIDVPLSRHDRAHLYGTTNNVSTNGLYFTIDERLAVGTQLDFTLTMPAELIEGTEVLICGHGRIVRVDERTEDVPQSIGIAAVVEKYY